MKTYLLSFVLLLSLFSCKEKENDPKPVTPDPFIGSWYYSHPSLGLEVTFNVAEQGGEFVATNINIKYSEIPKGQVLDNNELAVFDQFEKGDGFGMIKVSAGNDLTWVFLSLIYNTIYQAGGKTEMIVHELRLDMINRATIVLDDQVFYKQ